MFVRFLRRLCVFAALLAVMLCHAVWAAPTRADARTDFLMKMLTSSSQFRVRAQAALALGGNADPVVIAALVRALKKDAHPAVRVASVTALERCDDGDARAALKEAVRDRDLTVRAAAKRAVATEAVATTPAISPPSRESREPEPGAASAGSSLYYVGVGVPASQVSALSSSALQGLREHLAHEVVQIAGVRLAPLNESQRDAERALRAQKLTGYYLDSSVTKVETKADGSIRAQVSIVVGTYPGRDIRAMLSGAATVSGGGSGDAVVLEAVQAAYTGALRRLPQAMQAGLARAP